MVAKMIACRPRRAVTAALRAALAAGALLPGVAGRAADDVVGPAGQAPPANAVTVIDPLAKFDQAVLEQAGGGWVVREQNVFATPAPPAAGSPALANVAALGAGRLEQLERICELSDAQRRTLQLALEADIARCMAGLEAARRGYAGRSVHVRDHAGYQQMAAVQNAANEWRRRLGTVFEENSLFAESLPTVLDERQLEALRADTAERRAFHWKAVVAPVLLHLDDMLALDQHEHEAIERLVLERTAPLRLDGLKKQRDEQADRMLVFNLLSKVEPRVLKELLGPARLGSLQPWINQGRARESWLQGQGLLDRAAP